MTVTVVLGWWMLPVVITFGLFLWALWQRESDRPTGMYDFNLMPVVRAIGAIIGSLFVWLVYFIVAYLTK